jgi:hypothetical protein
MDTLLCNDDGDVILGVHDGVLASSTDSLTVSTSDQVLNVYGAITSATVSTGATSFTVDDASLFTSGDVIMIYQTQNGASTTVGYYEYRTISGVDTGTNTITVSEGLTNNYVSGTTNASPSYTAQIVRVQIYDTLTVNTASSITCDAWNGVKGGIVAIKCNTVVGSGTIHANYKGFRGGHYGTGNNSPGYVGEGIYGGGSTSLVSGRVTGVKQRTPLGGMNTGGSGGEGASHLGSGGGGGGHLNAGTEGRCRYAGDENPGGYAAPISESQIFFGGGGGGGGDDDNLASNSWGGHGGGIVILLCDSIASTIVLESKGENHSSNNITQTAAKGSGGAGGTLMISGTTSATTNVSGGLGYVNTLEDDTAYGGDGSIGRTFIPDETYGLVIITEIDSMNLLPQLQNISGTTYLTGVQGDTAKTFYNKDRGVLVASVTIDQNTQGIIYEGGGSSVGFVLYAVSGTLYCQAGTSSVVAGSIELSWPIPASFSTSTPTDIGISVEVLNSTSKMRMFVNTLEVAQTTTTKGNSTGIAGPDNAGSGQIYSGFPVCRISSAQATYTDTIYTVNLYPNVFV